MKPSYPDFFNAATSSAPKPCGCQRRLAEDPSCQSRPIGKLSSKAGKAWRRIPTGLGKTVGLVLVWLRFDRPGLGFSSEPAALPWVWPLQTLART